MTAHTTERLADVCNAIKSAHAFIGVMFGNPVGIVPETVDTPIGVPVKVRAIYRDLNEAAEYLAAHAAERALPGVVVAWRVTDGEKRGRWIDGTPCEQDVVNTRGNGNSIEFAYNHP